MVELGEQLGDHSVHYSGFGLLGDMLRDQTNFREEEEEEEEEEVLDNQLPKRSQQPTVIQARLPGYKPQEQKRLDGNSAESGLQDNLAEEERWQSDERKSPIYMEISQQVKVTKADDDGGLDEKNVLKKMEVEPFADSLDLLPLEVEVEVCLGIAVPNPHHQRREQYH